jgi:DNA-binding Lrp family transcriptional regulator
LLREVELKLVSELMKNSRRSDRELAKAIGITQPTVTRTRAKLEKAGIIKEYTMVPDFEKLGYHLMAVIFLKLKALSPEELDELYAESRKIEKQSLRTFFMVMNGRGIGQDMVAILFFRSYSEYARYMRTIREEATQRLKAYINVEDTEGFLINLDENTHYLPLTFSRIAANVGRMKGQTEE